MRISANPDTASFTSVGRCQNRVHQRHARPSGCLSEPDAQERLTVRQDVLRYAVS